MVSVALTAQALVWQAFFAVAQVAKASRRNNCTLAGSKCA
jgi:hypothetical protein